MDSSIDKAKAWDAIPIAPDKSLASDLDLITLPADRASDDDDSRMIEYNRRFQAAVLDNLGQQLQQLHSHIGQRDEKLSWSEQSRTDLAIALKRSNDQIPKLARSVKATTVQLTSAKAECGRLQDVVQDLVAKVNSLTDVNKAQSLQITTLNGRIEHHINENNKMRQLQNIVADDFRMHNMAHDGLRSEISKLQEEKRTSLKHLTLWQKKFEEAMSDVRDVTCESNLQQHETQLAQDSLSSAIKELDLLSKSNDALIRRWEESASAMNERDKAMAKLIADLTHSSKRVQILEILSNRYEADNHKLAAEMAVTEKKLLLSVKQNDEIVSNLKESETRERSTERALEASGLAYHQVLAALKEKEHIEIVRDKQIESRDSQIRTAKATIDELYNEASEKDISRSDAEKTFKAQIRGFQDEAAAVILERDHFEKLLHAANEKHAQVELTQNLQIVRLDKKIQIQLNEIIELQRRLEIALNHTAHVSEALVQMEGRACRSEQQVLILKELPIKPAEEANLKISALEEEGKRFRSKIQSLQVVYAKSEEQRIMLQGKLKQVEQERDEASGKATLGKFKSRRMELDLQQNEARIADIINEIDETRVENRRQTMLLNSYREADLVKEKKLVEHRLTTAEFSTHADAEISSLRHEIVVLRGTRTNLVEQINQAIKNQQKSELCINQLKSRLEVALYNGVLLTKEVKALTKQLKEAQRMKSSGDAHLFFQWAKKFDGMVQQGHVNMCKEATELPDIVSKRDTRRSNALSARQGQGVAGARVAPNALEKLQAESQVLKRLKTDIIRSRTELATKSAECNRLQQQIEAATIKCNEFRDKLQRTSHELELSRKQRDSLERDTFGISKRCVRAESMAANFEGQLIAVKNLNDIDYTYKDAEPSDRLFEVISEGTDDPLDKQMNTTDLHGTEKTLDDLMQKIDFE